MDSLDALIERSRERRQLPPPALRRALREEAGLSKREVAKALRVSAMTILHWERGSRFPGPDNLLAYSTFLRSLQRELVTDQGQTQ